MGYVMTHNTSKTSDYPNKSHEIRSFHRQTLATCDVVALISVTTAIGANIRRGIVMTEGNLDSLGDSLFRHDNGLLTNAFPVWNKYILMVLSVCGTFFN